MQKLFEKAVKEAFKEDEMLKKLYNQTLQRYYNGCNYIDEHRKEISKYLPEVIKLLDILNQILKRIPATEEEILNGFKT